ncbi:hypothetical protein ACX3O0_08565 [Homoserinimonas sp. A447]
MAVVPGPVRRVVRNRARVIAVAILALVSLAAAGINVTAADRLQSLLDENWRGAYDILVTAEGSEVAGLLAPNALAGGSETMTLEDLASIRSVAGIDVAAPIGEVIIPALASRQERFVLPRGAAGANQVPQAFRLTVTRHTDDGLGERLVSAEVYPLVVDETDHPEQEWPPCVFDDFEVDPEKYPLLAASCGNRTPEATVSYPIGGGWASGGEIDGDQVLFTLGSAVNASTRVTLVDPVAERALLGEAGDFLKPLEALSGDGPASTAAVEAWSASVDNDFTRAFAQQKEALDALQSGHYRWLAELKQLYEDNGSTIDFESSEAEYIPLVVRKTGPAPLTVTITVEAFGPAIASGPPAPFASQLFELPAALEAGDPGRPIGSTTVDASALLNPFNDREVRIPWPGTSTEVGEGRLSPYGMNIYALGSAKPPNYRVTSDEKDGVEVDVRSSGYLAPLLSMHDPNNMVPLQEDGTVAGVESTFISELRARAITSGYGFAAVPVGGFSLDGIADLQTELGHVPLGAYHALGSTVALETPRGGTSTVELNPSVSGLGLVSADTVAIASVDSAVAMGQLSPINAVRVRVADVDAPSVAGFGTIATVAQELQDLGFVATIVAGSSPTDVTLHVDDYAFGVTSADDEQEIGYLGAVTQRWSELGAASRVDLAVSFSSFGVLAVALAASALLLASVPGRRAQASVMRTIGWDRRQVFRWMAAEELVSLALIALAGIAALVVSGMRPSVGLVVGASTAVLVLTSALAVALGARPTTEGSRWWQRGARVRGEGELDAWVTSSPRFAVRQLVVHPTSAIVQLLATVVVGASAAAVAVTVLEGRRAAGDSVLGEFAFTQAFVSQAGLGLLALIAGIVLAVIARRIGLTRRREQWATMSAMGFSAGQLRMVQLAEGLLAGLPSLALAGATAWIYVGAVAIEFRELSLPVAAGAAGVLTVALVLAGWREKR